jgi:hypothetical protein
MAHDPQQMFCFIVLINNSRSRHCTVCNRHYLAGETLDHQRTCVLGSVMVVYRTGSGVAVERTLVRETTGDRQFRCENCDYRHISTVNMKVRGNHCKMG